MRYGFCLVAVVFLSAIPRLAAADYDRDDPDSLNVIFAIDLVRAKLKERSGAGVTEFHLYTTGEESRIAWWLDGKLFVYVVSGDQHVLRGTALLARLHQHGLKSFVAPRRPSRRHSFTEVFDVSALQVMATLEAAEHRGR